MGEFVNLTISEIFRDEQHNTTQHNIHTHTHSYLYVLPLCIVHKGNTICCCRPLGRALCGATTVVAVALAMGLRRGAAKVGT